MASRKEQKEQLRREREEREAAARAAERRRRTIGYAAAGVVVAVVAVVLVVLLVSGGGNGDGGGSKEASADVLPDGGTVPDQTVTELEEAVRAAGGELKKFRGGGANDHTQDLSEVIRYDSNPPTHGRHYERPAEDLAYEEAPDVKEVVHALEHGRIVIWFKKDLPAEQRADLKALYDEDPYQMLLVPNETDMPYQMAVSAWNREPVPAGTGRLLGFPEYNEKIFDAIRAFKDEHRSNGPEPVP